MMRTSADCSLTSRRESLPHAKVGGHLPVATARLVARHDDAPPRRREPGKRSLYCRVVLGRSRIRVRFPSRSTRPGLGESAPVPGEGLARALEGGVAYERFGPEPVRPRGGQPVLPHDSTTLDEGAASGPAVSGKE
jgi:hypothetical protein